MMCRALLADRRGAVTLESLVAFVPVLVFFIVLIQICDAYAAQLIVRRAASAATRAAVVVLPDDGQHYGDPGNGARDSNVGQRQRDIRQAASQLLDANRGLRNARVVVRGGQQGHDMTTVEVSADYRCLFSLLSLVCGRDKILQLSASATLPYQGAHYAYEP